MDKTIQKSLGEILESYDEIAIDVLNSTSDVKFHITPKRHRIHMMFQKRYSDQLNLARDDIFNT